MATVRSSKLRTLILAIIILSAPLIIAGCATKEPIRIGFAAELTGRQAELGVQERNGVQMAIDKINASGGIAGRKVELLVRDDLGTINGAQNADRDLIEAGVVAIIGHATSKQSQAGLSITEPAKMLLLSPTTSSAEFSSKDDYFFRLVQTLVDRARGLAEYTIQRRGLARLAVIYDTNNDAYVQSYLKTFSDEYKILGGEIVGQESFDSMLQTDFDPLLLKLRKQNPNVLLIITGDADAALIAQRARLSGWQIPLMTTSWAETQTLIENGGLAVEGMELEQLNCLNNLTTAYSDFVSSYETRYGKSPSFGAFLGYDATQVLAMALEKTDGKAEGLKAAMLTIRDYQGLVDTISFDEYGDVVESFSLCIIRNGKFVNIDNY